MTTGPRLVVVGPEDEGDRLDKVLTRRLVADGVSRSLVSQCFADGRVTAGGVARKPSERPRAGLVVTVDLPAPPPSVALAEDIALDVVFEDEHLLVVDKPAGMVVHPARGHDHGTLVNAVLHHAAVEDLDPVRPGIVHRIDRDTSGLLVVARTRAARDGLAALFKRHDVERSYIALIEGVPHTSMTFDTLHGRHATDRKRYTSRVTEGRRAVTHVALLETFANGRASRLRCTLETGRTHQIRVHLSEHGFPLLGDGVYGRTPRDPWLKGIAATLGRQALHAAVLGFVHPVTGAALRFESPLPGDLVVAVESLRNAPK